MRAFIAGDMTPLYGISQSHVQLALESIATRRTGDDVIVDPVLLFWRARPEAIPVDLLISDVQKIVCSRSLTLGDQTIVFLETEPSPI
jgi:hypothetical protein